MIKTYIFTLDPYQN